MTRILVCSDRIGAADPAEAGRAIATAFSEASAGRAQLAVVGLSAGGRDLADVLGAYGVESAWVHAGGAFELGRRLRLALDQRPSRLHVDLTGLSDASGAAPAALLAGAGLAGIIDASATGRPEPATVLREVAGGTDLVGVLPPGEEDAVLLGLDGVVARHGFDTGLPAADVLAGDATLAELATRLGCPDAPGLGAAGGAGLVIAAFGGRLASGFALCAHAAALESTMRRADLIVVGTDTFTIGDFGGPVVRGVAATASEVGVPVLAVAREADISTRELRRHGVEAVHALGGGADLAAAGITRRCGGVARTWSR